MISDKIEQAWYQGGWVSWLLIPLSWLFAGLSALRRWLFKVGIKSTDKIDLPVIVVGNISVGGTGKTPMVLYLIERLKILGLRPGVISRGYGATTDTFPHWITPDDDAALVGDEPKLISQRACVPVVIAPDRVAAARVLARSQACDIIISDDGLQHYQLERDLEIILIDGQRKLGNGRLLPAGPLREGEWRLKTSDFVVYNGDKTQAMSMQIQASRPVPVMGNDNRALPKAVEWTLFSGIGNPQRFYQTVEQLGLSVVDNIEFADHHAFTEQDLIQYQDKHLLMTEKDAVKCQQWANDKAWYLPIEAKLSVQFEKAFFKQVLKIRDHYGI